MHPTRPETAIARELNPAAGYHPVATDPREVDASRAATRRVLEAFPYYERRYGSRAAEFGVSDGAWIAALSTEPPETVRQQLVWLGRVLASRGMPTLLLERFLELLGEELVRAVPDRASGYAVLASTAAELRGARERSLSPARAAEVERAFDAAVAGEGEPWARGFGAVLAAAAADERSGYPGAVESVESWAADPVRWGTGWLRAVENTLRLAREGEGGGGEEGQSL